MSSLITLFLLILFCHSPQFASNTAANFPQSAPREITTVYDRAKDRTTVRLPPVQISGARGKYHRLHMAPSFTYPGQEPRTPEIIDFELQTTVRGKLKIDLYVLFVVDGEKIFLSSNRWGVKKGKLGRGWMGEHLVFRMPYETFAKIINSRTFEISFDGVRFPVGNDHIGALRILDFEIKNTLPARR